MVSRIGDDVVQESERHRCLILAGVPANEILREIRSCVCADHEATYRPINHMHFARRVKTLTCCIIDNKYHG